MSLDDDRARLASLAEAVDTGHPWTWGALGHNGYPQRVTVDGTAQIVCEVYTDPDAAYPLAEYLAAVSPPVILDLLRMAEDGIRARAALAAVEALVIEADAAHVQYLAGPILDRFIVPANVTTERIRTAIRDALEAR